MSDSEGYDSEEEGVVNNKEVTDLKSLMCNTYKPQKINPHGYVVDENLRLDPSLETDLMKVFENLKNSGKKKTKLTDSEVMKLLRYLNQIDNNVFKRNLRISCYRDFGLINDIMKYQKLTSKHIEYLLSLRILCDNNACVDFLNKLVAQGYIYTCEDKQNILSSNHDRIKKWLIDYIVNVQTKGDITDLELIIKYYDDKKSESHKKYRPKRNRRKIKETRRKNSCGSCCSCDSSDEDGYHEKMMMKKQNLTEQQKEMETVCKNFMNKFNITITDDHIEQYTYISMNALAFDEGLTPVRLNVLYSNGMMNSINDFSIGWFRK